ncbi:MAG: hypothetical protein ACKO42_02475, partial [Gammaproteobacteria bacterium]
ISRLSHVVDTNLETTRAVRNAPAIFGAIMMSVGIVMAVVVAMVFSKMNERAAALDAAIIAQNETLEKVEETLKGLSTLEGNLEKFQKIADDTTQRAIVTLREQVKTDRVALQQLEARRLNEMLASLRGAIDAAPRAGASRQSEEGKRFSAIEKSMSGLEGSVTRIDQRLATMEKQGEDRRSETSGKRPVAVLSDAQAKDMKATAAEVGRLKSEIASLRELIERRRSELQSGEPAIRKEAR